MLKKVWDWILPILIGVIIAFGVTRVLGLATTDGPSMLPTLQDKQRMWVSKISKIERGDIVVFDATKEDPGINKGGKTNQKYYVKRVIGVGGDTVEAKDGNLYVNGKKVNQNYLSQVQRESGTGNWTLKSLSGSNTPFKTAYSYWDDGKAVKVPKGQYFVLGDNRRVSEDGRYFGFVKKKHILGVAHAFPWQGHGQAANKQADHFFA